MDEIQLCCEGKETLNYTSKINEEISFCGSCGSIILPGKVFGLKPDSLKYLIEIDPFSLLETMNKSSSYINKRLNKNYLVKRAEIIKNLSNIFNKLKYKRKTFYLTILYLDIILCTVSADVKMELSAIVCMLISAKFDEEDPLIPDYKELQTIYNKQNFSCDNLRKYEILCLKALGYKLRIFSAFNYIQHFAVSGYVFTDDLMTRVKKGSPLKISKKSSLNLNGQLTRDDSSFSSVTRGTIEKIYDMTFEVLGYVIEDSKILEFKQLQIAFACIMISREANNLKDAWSSNFEKIYKVNYEEVKNCFITIKSILLKKKIQNSELNFYLQNILTLGNFQIQGNSISQSNTSLIGSNLTNSTCNINYSPSPKNQAKTGERISPKKSGFDKKATQHYLKTITQKENKKDNHENTEFQLNDLNASVLQKNNTNFNFGALEEFVENNENLNISVKNEKYNENLIFFKKSKKKNKSTQIIMKNSRLVTEVKETTNNRKSREQENNLSLSMHKDLVGIKNNDEGKKDTFTQRTARIDLQEYKSVEKNRNIINKIQNFAVRKREKKETTTTNELKSVSSQKDIKIIKQYPTSLIIDLNDLMGKGAKTRLNSVSSNTNTLENNCFKISIVKG